MYQPSKEQTEADRAAAYSAGIPHGEGLAGASLHAGSTLHASCCMPRLQRITDTFGMLHSADSWQQLQLGLMAHKTPRSLPVCYDSYYQ
jgi:hypothetical protein